MAQPARNTRQTRTGPPRRGATVGSARPHATQRQRLIDAIIELAGGFGYQGLSIAQISARAGVSSATFYEQFADREECMLAAYKAVTERTLARMAGSLQQGEWASAARPAFTELLRTLSDEPHGGRAMVVDALAAGP